MIKRLLFATLLTIGAFCTVCADDVDGTFFYLKSGNVLVAGMSDFDQLTYRNDSVMVNDTLGLKVSEVDSIMFAEKPGKLKITYDGSSARWINPYWIQGVTVSTSGADVTVNNPCSTEELTTKLRGVSSDGSFVYNGSYKTTIELDSLTLTNTRGAAIDIEDGKRVALEIAKGTVNTIVDGSNGGQKAALYCKGHLEIDKSGTLNVTGNTAHAIQAKEYIQLKKSDGTINILGAKKDGIHCKQFFMGKGFTVNISGAADECIQVELDSAENDEGIADGSMVVYAGTYNLTNSTAGGKGIKVAGTYVQGVEGGEGPDMTVTTTGSSTNARLLAGMGGPGGWNPGGGGTPGGGGVTPGGGGTTSGSSAKAIKVQGAVTVYGGTTHVSTAADGAEGLESKTGIKIAGGNHYFKCYDDCINSSGIIEFAGGNTVCYSTGNDAVDSNYGRTGAITLSGGNVFAYTSKGGAEEGFDSDNNSYIKITGGICISAGGQQGGGGGWGGSSTSSSVGSSTQGYYLGSSPSSYGTTYYYTMCNTSGTPICTYRFEGSVSNSLGLLTASNLGTGSVTVKYGTSAPTAYDSCVANAGGTGVLFINPTVTTTGTTATVTAK